MGTTRPLISASQRTMRLYILCLCLSSVISLPYVEKSRYSLLNPKTKASISSSSRDFSLLMTAKKEDSKISPLINQSWKYIATFIGGGLLGAMLLGSMEPTIRSGDDIPSKYFQEQRVVQGTIVKVIDGDTYKFYKKPGLLSFSSRPSDPAKDTITIRIAGVDTPETPKFGQPGQRYGLEAKEYATKKLLGKSVKVKLLKKDQYNRVLGVVRYSDNFISSADISEELLKQGLATVYRQGGAQYDGRLDVFTRLERDAIKAKKGIWKDGEAKADLPSAYKKKIKANK
jgi:micrococcal nuclease